MHGGRRARRARPRWAGRRAGKRSVRRTEPMSRLVRKSPAIELGRAAADVEQRACRPSTRRRPRASASASSSPESRRVAKPYDHSTSPRNASPFSASRTALVATASVRSAPSASSSRRKSVSTLRTRAIGTGQQPAAGVDALAEPRDDAAAHDLLDARRPRRRRRAAESSSCRGRRLRRASGSCAARGRARGRRARVTSSAAALQHRELVRAIADSRACARSSALGRRVERGGMRLRLRSADAFTASSAWPARPRTRAASARCAARAAPDTTSETTSAMTRNAIGNCRIVHLRHGNPGLVESSWMGRVRGFVSSALRHHPGHRRRRRRSRRTSCCGIAMRPNWEIAERHAQDVVSWERSMHIEWEEGLQQTFLRLPELVRAMNVFYFVGHFVLTGIFFFWLYHTSPRRLQPLPQRLPGRDVHRARHSLALPDRAAAARRHRPRGHAPLALEHRHRLADLVVVLEPGRRRAVAARRLGARRRDRPRPLRAAALLEARRRLLPDRGRPDDRRHGQPLRLRRARRDARDGARFLAFRDAFRAATVLQSTPRRGVEQSGSSPGS